MGFKKTSEGRVFFEKLEDTANDELGNKPSVDQGFRTRPFARNGYMDDQQTQVQIVALLKTLNERLKSTQAERNQMRKELDAYRDLISDLENKSTRSEKAFIELQEKLDKTEKADKPDKAEALANEALKEMEETRRLLLNLEGKTEKADAILTQLKSDVTRHQDVGNHLIKRQKSLEELQRHNAEKVTEHAQIASKIVQRIKDGEQRIEVLSDKVEETSHEQGRITRKLDKAIEERTRFMRKIERIEETVLQMRDSLNAKAMVLLTDQDVVSQADLEDQTRVMGTAGLLKAGSESVSAQVSAPAPEQRHKEHDSSEHGLVVKPWHFLVLGGVVLAGVVGLWAANNWDQISLRTQPQEETFKFSNIEKTIEDNNVAGDLTAEIEQTQASDEAIAQSVDQDESTDTFVEENYMDDIGATELNNADDIAAALEGRSVDNIDDVAPIMNAIEPGDPVAVSENNASAIGQEETLAAIDLASLKKTPSEIIKPDSNLEGALKNMENKAFAGTAEAQHDLAAVYTAGYSGVKQDFERARLWFEQAAARGVENAAYNLGVIYHQGLGVEADIKKAMQWYGVAAQKNHPEAQYNLGIAYIEGIGVPYNAEKATAYFTNAANQNIMEAAYNLGLIHENGLLGAAKPDEALMWYKIAADQGSPEAKQALDQLAKNLDIDLKEVNRLADGMKNLKKPETRQAIEQRVTQTVPNENLNQQILVSQVQDYLMKLGLYPGPADGISGPLTVDAVRSYQKQNNLDPDGQLSQNLLDHMNERLGQ